MDALLTVLTIREVAHLWGKHPDTVRLAMGARRRPLIFRKTARVYLITYDSCVRRWGPPRRSLTQP